MFLSLSCSSLSHRLPAASPSTLSISGAGAASSSSSSDRCRLTRGSTIRSTFHGGQLRDRGPPVYSAPPTSPTLSHHDASPLPHARTRATSNLFTKLTSKLTRRYFYRSIRAPHCPRPPNTRSTVFDAVYIWLGVIDLIRLPSHC